MPTFYTHPFSSHARRVAALLEITGIDAERRVVALDKGEHMQPAYLAINPNHQVPAWVDDAVTMSESNAILRYLCARHGLEAWYPSAVAVRATVDQWLDWSNSRLSPAVTGVVFNSRFAPEPDEVAIARGYTTLEELGGVLETALAERAFLAGDAPTIADLSVAALVVQLRLVEATLGAEHTAAWLARVLELEGFRRALPPSMPS